MAKAPRASKGRGSRAGGAKPKSTPRREPSRPRPAAPSGKSYEIVCSECYSSFAMYQSSSFSSVTCPECLHVGNAGAKDTMSKIAIAKSTEQGNLMKSLIFGVLFALSGLIWTTWLTAAAMAGESVGAGTNYGFLAATSIFFILAVGLGIKYEANRYEVYF